jgi:hypothetical protein
VRAAPHGKLSRVDSWLGRPINDRAVALR